MTDPGDWSKLLPETGCLSITIQREISVTSSTPEMELVSGRVSITTRQISHSWNSFAY